MEAKKPFGRSLSDFFPLRAGEQKLLEACREGREAVLSNGLPMPLPLIETKQELGPWPLFWPIPDKKPERVSLTVENCVRADFVRFLLLGGDDQSPVHERGVMLNGAFIGGELSLRSCNIPASLMLRNCFFSGELNAQDATISGVLGLPGSHLAAGLKADRLKCEGSVFLRAGFTAKGVVRLHGAKIDGNLECSDGLFDSRKDNALIADGANFTGNVILGEGFTANGVVRLLSVEIGGDLDCVGGRFAKISDIALSFNGAVVHGSCFVSELPKSVGIDASHADVGVLIDDSTTWAKGSSLSGFRYRTFGGKAPINGKERIAWLLKQPPEHLNEADFRPQPWRHLHWVLREMGHTEDAKQVGIAFEDHLRKIDRMGKWPNDPGDLVCGFKGIVTRTAHYMFGKLAGYGYRPVDLVMWMLGVWLACAGVYWYFASPPYAAIAPSEPLVFQDARYSECRPQAKESVSIEKQKGQDEQPDKKRMIGNWPLCSDMPGEYSTFSPLAYSLDLLLPVVDLGQEKYWGAYIPSPNESAANESILNWRWGYFVRFVTWFETLFGWVSSLLLVAIISGFSRRNDEG
ncbi:hypothetical protein [Comamonas terrigena]|uniref:hypothetical protein n=1 Tax=Comamonas terrigena TaxID=32013 RepID=UPI0024494974|nr:hypothetical protein [Comamonas terrigena]MDH1700254.1 hypothetical protein [Comamonas terrigena]